MNWYRKNPLFTSALTLCALLVLGEGWLIYDRFAASRAAAKKLVQRESELMAMKDLAPVPTRPVATAIEGDLARAQRAVAALQAATEAGDFESLKAATDAWKEHCKPVAPTGPAFEAAASKLAVLKAERDSRGWKYPPQLSPSSTRRSLSPQKSGAVASAEHSATVVATLEARTPERAAATHIASVAASKAKHERLSLYLRSTVNRNLPKNCPH